MCVTDLVNVERVDDMIPDFLFLSCLSSLVHAVNRFDIVGWFNCDQVILNLFSLSVCKIAFSI